MEGNYHFQLLDNLTKTIGTMVWKDVLVGAVISYTVYSLLVAVYNVYWHPLARFPGPLLCRMSWVQQCYYEAILGGKLLERLPAYHQKYGPVVRINPNQIHIDDPEVFHEIFKQNSKFTKDPVQYGLGVSKALAFTLDIAQHSAKRRAVEPLFSKRRVSQWENELYRELDLLFDRINEYEERGENVPLQEMYYCYTGDVISQFLLGKSLNLMSGPDFIQRADQLRDFSRTIWLTIHFPVIRKTLTSLPRWLAAKFNDTLSMLLAYSERAAKQAIALFNKDEAITGPEHDTTLFRVLLRDNAKRRLKHAKLEKTDYRELADESTGVLTAGTEPTATMMAYATYHFLKYPDVQHRILEELDKLKVDQSGRLSLEEIETLPYFTAFVRETLRFVPLVPGRLPRIVPKGGLFVPSIQDTIPEGTVVGVGHLSIHRNPEIFDRPNDFDPTRWIGDGAKKLDHWLLSFSKGRTDCIGKTLAYAEMHLVLANLFTQYELEMVPGTHEGMQWQDLVIVHPKSNLHVKVCKRKRGSQLSDA